MLFIELFIFSFRVRKGEKSKFQIQIQSETSKQVKTQCCNVFYRPIILNLQLRMVYIDTTVFSDDSRNTLDNKEQIYNDITAWPHHTLDPEQTKRTHKLSTDTKQAHTCNLHSVYSFLAGGSATAADDGADTAGIGAVLTDVEDLFFSAACIVIQNKPTL